MNKRKILIAAGMNAAVYLAIYGFAHWRASQLNKALVKAYKAMEEYDDIVVSDQDMQDMLSDIDTEPPEVTDKYARMGAPEHSAQAREHREKVLNEEEPELIWREATPEDLEKLDPDEFEFLIGSPAVLRSIIAGTAESDFEGLMEEADKSEERSAHEDSSVPRAHE